jgi:hypothetical protein
MSKLTQGTEIFFIDPDTSAVTKVTGVSTFNPGGAPADQIEDTDLESDVRTYKRGLRTPGQATMTIFADPTNASHIRLHELSVGVANENIKWAVGWSDGTADPTADSNGEFVYPQDSSLNYNRTFYNFEGYVADFPFDFSINTVVTSNLAIQRSGTGVWYAKGVAA